MYENPNVQQHPQQPTSQVPGPTHQPVQGPQVQPEAFGGRPPFSGLAVAGFVLGVVSLSTSMAPIFNSISFFAAIVGIVLAAIGIAKTRNHLRRGRGLAVAGIVTSILAVVLVLASQSAYESAVNSAIDGPQATSAVDLSTATAVSPGSLLPVPASITLDNGLSVSVDSVDLSGTNYDGSPLTCVHVSYVNGGSEVLSYNPYDWKAESPSGSQESFTWHADEASPLQSGTLAPGGSVTGTVCFDGSASKVLYYGSILSDTPTGSWAVQ